MYTPAKDDTVATLKNAQQNFRNAAGEAAEDVKEDLREAAGRAGRKVRSFIHTAGDEITHAKDTVTTEVRANPVRSSMIALGLGVVLGALLRR